MAEIKMTQVQALEIAIAEMVNADAKAILEHMVEVKKNAAARKRERSNNVPSKKAIENAEMAAKFAAEFEGETFTNANVREFFTVSASKATAIIKAGEFEEVPATGKTKVFKH